MTEITYIDDFDYLPETAFLNDNEINKEIQREKEKKEAELLKINENSTIHVQSVYRPLEKQTMKPWNGPLNRDPDKMVFATWCDYLSYKEAWSKKNSNTFGRGSSLSCGSAYR